MDKEKLKADASRLKEQAKFKAWQAIEFARENPTLVIAGTALVSKAIWEIGRGAKRRQVDRLEEAKTLRVYDPMMDSYWQLKRKMSNSELAEFKQRLDSGQSRGDALRDMKLLK